MATARTAPGGFKPLDLLDDALSPGAAVTGVDAFR